VPPWVLGDTDELMVQVGSATTIFSLTAPGAPIANDTQAARELARQVNQDAAELRDKNPARYGFFAALPSLLDTEGALAEIAYALDTLQADGVTVFTRYGSGHDYLGSKPFAPIWAELNRRKAVVFVHPTHAVDTHFANPALLQPMVDYPHETTRTAMDLILSDTKRNHPDCKVILSHAGGTLPYLVKRVANIMLKTNFSPKAPHEILEDARSFYFDLALSSSHQVLRLLLDSVPTDHILYGSDFPYARHPGILAFADELESFPMDQDTRDKIYFKNAYALLPRLASAQKSA
jgi:6-methylsalicylate decarboxylase